MLNIRRHLYSPPGNKIKLNWHNAISCGKICFVGLTGACIFLVKNCADFYSQCLTG